MSTGSPCEMCGRDNEDITLFEPVLAPPLKLFNRILRHFDRSIFKPWKNQPLLYRQTEDLDRDVLQVFPATKMLPIHLTLFGLPAELRIIIYKFVFADGGMDVIRRQLRSGHIGNLNIANNVNTLLVCRQFYNEAFSFAYKQTHFYYFKNYAFKSLDTLLTQLRPSQMENLRKVAVWTNPYILERYFENVPVAIHLTSITICCNFMCSRIPDALLLPRARWIYNIVKKIKSLKQLNFRTGCRVSGGKDESIDSDCEFSADLRGALEKISRIEKGCTLGPFDRETKIATLHFDELGESRTRSVELMVASVYEVDL
jgi:hypothetical protein